MVTSQVHLIMPAHVNSNNRLFGGQLVAWIDIAAAVAARRHTRSEITTVSIDHLDFLAPASLGDLVIIETRVTWTGRTSLEVLAESYVECLDGKRNLINRAFLVFVALDDEGKPREVPSIIPQTEKEKKEWESAEKRREYRLSLRGK